MTGTGTTNDKTVLPDMPAEPPARDEAAYEAALDIYDVTQHIRKFDKALRYVFVEIDYLMLKTKIDPSNVMLELMQLDKRFSDGAKVETVFLDTQRFSNASGNLYVGRGVNRKAREEDLYGILFLMKRGVIGKVPDETYTGDEQAEE